MPTHIHKMPSKKRLGSVTEIAKILETVPHEKGFHFYNGLGYSTGETATSLDNFVKKLQVVVADSVNFHFQRGDFQKWIEDTLGDKELAKRVSLIKPPISVEELRKELIAIVQTRITELRHELTHHLRHANS